MSNFFQELRRRNVIKAAITYVVVSWAVLQALGFIFPLFDLSQNALRFILYVLLGGFPLWLIFAYIFEWTPTGFQKTESVTSESSVTKQTGKTLNRFTIVGLAFAVLLLVVDKFFSFSFRSGTDARKSVAVLPFENNSSTEDAYFTAGVADDILTQIAKIGDLRVLSRFTVKDYNTKGKTVQQIGDDLGVGYLLMGSVRKEADQVRISCQLVQVNPEEEAWAENFDKRMQDIFAIQSSVAQQVAQSLKAKLTPEEKSRIEKIPTGNLEAYNLYLLGNGLQNLRSEDNERAIDFYKQALALDPNFLPAYINLVRALYRSVNFYGVRPITFYDTTLAMAQKAVDKDPESADAVSLLGVQYYLKGNLTQAKEVLERAHRLSPNNAAALNGLGVIKMQTGELVEAVEFLRQAVKIDPFRAYSSRLNLGYCYSYLGMFDEALKTNQFLVDAKKIEELALSEMCNVYAMTGKKENLRQSIDKLLSIRANADNLNIASRAALEGEFGTAEVNKYFSRLIKQKEFSYSTHARAVIAKSYYLKKEGKLDSANLLLQKTYNALHESYGEDNVSGQGFISYAKIEILKDNLPKAVEWLKKYKSKKGLSCYSVLKYDYLLKPLHNDNAYKTLLAELEPEVDKSRLAISAVLKIENE